MYILLKWIHKNGPAPEWIRIIQYTYKYIYAFGVLKAETRRENAFGIMSVERIMKSTNKKIKFYLNAEHDFIRNCTQMHLVAPHTYIKIKEIGERKNQQELEEEEANYDTSCMKMNIRLHDFCSCMCSQIF